ATALIAAPVTQTFAQAAAPAKPDATKTETTKTKKTTRAKKEPEAKTEAKTEKKLTPQQQKMKDCAGKWKEEKATKKVSGRAAYRTFMRGCLKGSACPQKRTEGVDETSDLVDAL